MHRTGILIPDSELLNELVFTCSGGITQHGDYAPEWLSPQTGRPP